LAITPKPSLRSSIVLSFPLRATAMAANARDGDGREKFAKDRE
jgi:hypothetical protein